MILIKFLNTTMHKNMVMHNCKTNALFNSRSCKIQMFHLSDDRTLCSLFFKSDMTFIYAQTIRA